MVRQASERGDDEEDLIFSTLDQKPTSRLSCQIILNDNLDGLKLALTPSARKDSAEAAGHVHSPVQPKRITPTGFRGGPLSARGVGMDTYAVFKLLHVLAAIARVGGGLTLLASTSSTSGSRAKTPCCRASMR